MFRLIFDIAGGKRADADCICSRRACKRFAIVHHIDAGNAFGRHGVDIGCDKKMLCMRQIGRCHHLHACYPRSKYELRTREFPMQLLGRSRCNARCRNVEAAIDFIADLGGARLTGMACDRNVRAERCRHRSGHAPDRARAAEYEHALAAKIDVMHGFEMFFC